MTTAIATIDELVDERAKQLDIADDITRSAKEADRKLTDDEKATHDAAITRFDELTEDINRAKADAVDVVRAGAADVRRAGISVPNVNLNRDAVRGGRSLDDLLWATADVVRAGTIGDQGVFRANTAYNPVEQVVMRAKDDSGEGVLAPRISEFRPDDVGAVRSFQRTVADMCLFGLMVDKKASSSADGFQVARSHRAFKDRWTSIMRALDTDTAAEGTEWVPTGIGANLHEKVRAAGKIAPLFPRIDIPTNPWKWPLEGADATAYRVAEPTADNASKVGASTPGTGAATFDAEIMGGRILFSKSIEADSALAILPFASMKLVKAFVDGEEKAILDGDSDGTHQDTDVQALGSTDMRTAWDGLRKRFIAQTLVTATTCTALKLGDIRKGMGKWGVNPADLAFIIGVSNYHALLADTNLLTVDKMGPHATLLSGQVGSVFGVPVIVSEHVREVLNASGVEDGITQTKTYMICVNRNEWAMGARTPLDIEVDDSIYRESYQRVILGFQREDFQNLGASTDENTAGAYNVTP